MSHFLDDQLEKAIRNQWWTTARWFHRQGGRHCQLWTLMIHANQLNCVEKGSLFKYYPSYATVRFYRHSLPHIIYDSAIHYRPQRARQAAVAILGLKRRGLLCKDMATLIAQTVYLNYENRYSDKWKKPLSIELQSWVFIRVIIAFLACWTIVKYINVIRGVL